MLTLEAIFSFFISPQPIFPDYDVKLLLLAVILLHSEELIAPFFLMSCKSNTSKSNYFFSILTFCSSKFYKYCINTNRYDLHVNSKIAVNFNLNHQYLNQIFFVFCQLVLTELKPFFFSFRKSSVANLFLCLLFPLRLTLCPYFEFLSSALLRNIWKVSGRFEPSTLIRELFFLFCDRYSKLCHKSQEYLLNPSIIQIIMSKWEIKRGTLSEWSYLYPADLQSHWL